MRTPARLLLACCTALLALLGWWLVQDSPPAPPTPEAGSRAVEMAQAATAGTAQADGEATAAMAPGEVERRRLEAPSALPRPEAAQDPVLPVQVLDFQERPFAGVTWTLWSRPQSGMEGHLGPPRDSAPLAMGQADGEGRFDLPLTALPEAMGRLAVQMGMVDLALVLRHPELVDAYPVSDIPSTGPWTIHLARTEATAVGQVLTADGAPAARAELRQDGHFLGWTDAQGRFRLALPELSDGQAAPSLQVFHPAGQLQCALDRPDLGVLRLADGLPLSGRVVDGAGRGLPGLELQLSHLAEDMGDAWGSFSLPRQRSAADGSFRFNGLPPGRYRLHALGPSATGLGFSEVPMRVDGRPLDLVRAGQQGLRLEAAIPVLVADLQWPPGSADRPRWMNWGWQEAGQPRGPEESHFLALPPRLLQVWTTPLPEAGVDLEFHLQVEGFQALRIPQHVAPNELPPPLLLRPQLLPGVGSLRLDLHLPEVARGWQLDYRLEPMDGQVMPPELLRLALPSLEPTVQPTLLLDLPQGRYRLRLAETAPGPFSPPPLHLVGDDTLMVEAGRLQRWEFQLEADDSMPSPAPSAH